MYRLLTIILLCLGLNACGSANNTTTTTTGASAQGRLIVGATFSSLQTTQFTTWEGKSGHRLHRVNYILDFNSLAPKSATLSTLITDIDASMAAGYSVMLSLEPSFGDPYASILKQFTAGGTVDPYITAFISGIQSLQATWPAADIWMRFGHGMNSDRYPWGGLNAHNSNMPQDYINAWQYIVGKFNAAGLGASMVQWIWAPEATSTDTFTQYYPGNGWVDRIGMTGFNYGPKTKLYPTEIWQSFSTIFKFSYDTLTAAYPQLPFFISSVSCAESGGGKGAWIDDMAVQLLNAYPLVTGVFWFDINTTAAGEADWRIDSSPAALVSIQNMYATPKLWQR